jgi:hypothetical protein
MARTRATLTDRLVQQINAYCEEERWFWVAGLARETWPALLPVKEALHEVAQMAVEHYADEAP